MILERKMQMNIDYIQEQFKDDIIDSKEDKAVSSEIISSIVKLLHMYNSAMKEISTKFEILDNEFHVNNSNNPIHHLECRVKGLKSIDDKLARYGLEKSIKIIRENVLDIAGVRVICNFIDDIYLMEELLLAQTDVTLLKRKDYIKNPKDNGYRSLHIVVTIPVFLSNKVETVPVEIQMRTVAMDYWASLEHTLRYKNNKENIKEYSDLLLDCANTLAKTEKTMQYIRNSIS